MAISSYCCLVVFLFGLCWHNICAVPQTLKMVDVHNELPGHIAFTFYNNDDFVPVKLTANMTSQRQEVSFISIGDREKKTFRNIAPQNLSVLDVVAGHLIYQQSTENNSPRREITFQYLITNKQSDTFSIDLRNSRPLPHGLETTHVNPVCDTQMTPAETENPPPPPACIIPPPTPCNATVSTNERIEYLERLLNTTLEHTKIGTRLLMHMPNPPRLSAVDNIRNVLTDKLHLPHLKYSLLQAKYIDEGLLFEMATPRDALEVLTQVRLPSNKNRVRITTTERNFFEVLTFLRMGN